MVPRVALVLVVVIVVIVSVVVPARDAVRRSGSLDLNTSVLERDKSLGDVNEHGGALLAEDQPRAEVISLVAGEDCHERGDRIYEHVHGRDQRLQVLVLHEPSHQLQGHQNLLDIA